MDEANVHAAEVTRRLYDLLGASGDGSQDRGVLLACLDCTMCADDISVWKKTEEQRNAPARRLTARRCEAEIVERFTRPGTDRPFTAGASRRARKRAAYSAARSSRALARW